MAPETKLETWSHQGAFTTASATANSIKGVLDRFTQWPQGIRFDTYFSGSYKNSTNIRADSDVDIVAQLRSVFRSNLTEDQKRQLGHMPANYTWQNFKEHILTALTLTYGIEIVLQRNKAIKVVGTAGRLSADVVPTITYRKYSRVEEYAYVEGICFWTANGGSTIINFPNQHYDNGVTKMVSTENNYKSTVRIFKNIKKYLVDNNTISREVAPSYFIECLLYNVPARNYVGTTWQAIIQSVLNWLRLNSDWSGFICQNGIQNLFGTDTTQWSETAARSFLGSVINLWNNWR